MIVEDGLNQVANWLGGNAPYQPSGAALGSDATAVTFVDTALGSEITDTRDVWSATTFDDRRVEFEHIMDATEASGETLREFGVVSNGSIYFHDTFTPITQDGSTQIISSINFLFR